MQFVYLQTASVTQASKQYFWYLTIVFSDVKFFEKKIKVWALSAT